MCQSAHGYSKLSIEYYNPSAKLTFFGIFAYNTNEPIAKLLKTSVSKSYQAEMADFFRVSVFDGLGFHAAVRFLPAFGQTPPYAMGDEPSGGTLRG